MSWSHWAVSSKWQPGEHHFKTLRSTSPWFSVTPFYTLTSDNFLHHPHLLLLLNIYDLVVVIILCIPNTWTFGFHIEVVWGKGPTLCAIWASYETSTHYSSPHLQPGIWVSGIMRAVGTLTCHLQTEYQPPSDSIIAQGAGDIHKVWECSKRFESSLALLWIVLEANQLGVKGTIHTRKTGAWFYQKSTCNWLTISLPGNTLPFLNY